MAKVDRDERAAPPSAEEVALHGGRPIPHVVRIEPTRRWFSLKLGELWRSRELLYFFVWRDLKVRYKQTLLGAAWAIIQPFFLMVVFSLFFGKLAGISSEGVTYPLFSYAALLPWTYFSTALGTSSVSLVGQSQILRKVYLPRLAIPLGSVLTPLADFGIEFSVLLAMFAYYKVAPAPTAFLLLPLLLLALITALGAGLFLSALNVKYRDIGYTVPFIVQFWLFASPVVYGSTLIKSETLRTLFGLNPLTGVISGFRWALFQGLPSCPSPLPNPYTGPPCFSGDPPGLMLVLSCGVALLMLVVGATYFGHQERTFADMV